MDKYENLPKHLHLFNLTYSVLHKKNLSKYLYEGN